MSCFLRKDDVPASAMSARWGTINSVFPVLALTQGLLVLFGGANRWYGSSLEIMMTDFSGAHYVAGTLLSVAGLLLIISIRADLPFLIWLTAWVCAFWYFTAMACVIGQLVETPNGVGTLGPVTWFAFGLIHVIQAQGRVGSDEPVEEPSDDQNK